MSEPIVVSVDRGVGIIELARPEKFNCLSSRAWKLIDHARRDFEARQEVRAILVRARGKNFCTGADLNEVESIKGDPARIRALLAAALDPVSLEVTDDSHRHAGHAGARGGPPAHLPRLTVEYTDYSEWQQTNLAGPEGRRWAAR